MKLKLVPDPTFKAKVEIPVPGGSADIECEFKYRSKSDVAVWHDELVKSEASDPDALMTFLVSWNLDDEFNAENVAALCAAYPRAAHSIMLKYARELGGVREGN